MNRFFADVKLDGNNSTMPNTFKFFTSNKYKEYFAKIKTQTETRLNEEQKAVRFSLFFIIILPYFYFL